MSVKWFSEEMEAFRLVLRGKVDFGGRRNMGEPIEPSELPPARILAYTAYRADDWICGGVNYTATANGSKLVPFFFPLLDKWSKCWAGVRGDWQREEGWVQRNAVVCTRQYANHHRELPLNNRYFLQHLARMQGLVSAHIELGRNDGYEKSLLGKLDDRIDGLLKQQNRSTSEVMGAAV